jgi:hypothetical protein
MSSSITPKVIILAGDPIYKELPLQALDVYGDGGITPGYLCERTLTNEVKPHATAAGKAAPMFAIQNSIYEGRNINTVYETDGETVFLAYCRPGDEVYAWLAAGSGNDTTGAGTLLASNGDGTLKVSSTNPVARALEDIDNDPGTGGAAVRIKVEVL